MERLRMIWAMLTRRKFVCFAYDHINMGNGRVTGATYVASLPRDGAEREMFMNVVCECAQDLSKRDDSTH